MTFVGGDFGEWRVERIEAVRGDPLPFVRRLAMIEGGEVTSGEQIWALHGVTSNERYVGVSDREKLAERQQPLGRDEASHAALISISKTETWWNLTQEERLELFSPQSRHIEIGLKYLPAVARRLHHCRDVGNEPFDFLTWFEYPAESANAFEELVLRLRDTPEWDFVDHEVDIRLSRVPGSTSPVS